MNRLHNPTTPPVTLPDVLPLAMSLTEIVATGQHPNRLISAAEAVSAGLASVVNLEYAVEAFGARDFATSALTLGLGGLWAKVANDRVRSNALRESDRPPLRLIDLVATGVAVTAVTAAQRWADKRVATGFER